MAISTGLELTRLRGEIPDVRIVDAMRRWLVDHGDALGKWAYLASTVVVSLIKGYSFCSFLSSFEGRH